jgi:hypothetical protein
LARICSDKPVMALTDVCTHRHAAWIHTQKQIIGRNHDEYRV